MIELRDLTKQYQLGTNTVQALRGVTLTIEPNEFVAIMGPSGSGKSTLMHVIGLLDTPDAGSYRLYGKEVAHLSEDELAVLRRDVVGFVFQQFNLLPRMSAAENVALPLLYSRHRPDLVAAGELLTRVGLGDRRDHRPGELSGGERQR
ncbi:MAG TPA: MacB family efflux pump subunit, partial [Gammaproteobacteria bacterium]|nr:MacB family efflux pump subunit [Gammaproteobacteria bacterium]